MRAHTHTHKACWCFFLTPTNHFFFRCRVLKFSCWRQSRDVTLLESIERFKDGRPDKMADGGGKSFLFWLLGGQWLTEISSKLVYVSNWFVSLGIRFIAVTRETNDPHLFQFLICQATNACPNTDLLMATKNGVYGWLKQTNKQQQTDAPWGNKSRKICIFPQTLVIILAIHTMGFGKFEMLKHERYSPSWLKLMGHLLLPLEQEELHPISLSVTKLRPFRMDLGMSTAS